MNETKIEWCTHTWNPVTGCRHDCDYCYARTWARRFAPHGCERPMVEPLEILPKGSGCFYVEEPAKLCDESGKFVRLSPYPKGFAPTLHGYAMDYPEKRKIPSSVFVSSMGDLFGEWVPDAWIQEVFDVCKRAPWHTYLFLTKNPARYLELAQASVLPKEKNFWYGSTITGPNIPFFFSTEENGEAYNTFLSIEPLLEPLGKIADREGFPKWVIVGAMTGPGSKKRQPLREWVQEIVDAAREAGSPVLMKNSLIDIWGGNLIQEFPEGIPRADKAPPIPRCKRCEHVESKEQGKRGISYSCQIGWEAEGYDDRGARHIPGRYTRTSPHWCPRRKDPEA